MEMKFLKRAWLVVASVSMASAIFSSALMAQGVDASMLRNPPADSWPTYHGDYSGRRHSKLTQISRTNVGDLALAWAFQTGQTATHQIFPAAGGRNFVFHGAGKCLGCRCALRPYDLALHEPAHQRRSHRKSRRGDVQKLALLSSSRWTFTIPRREERPRACGMSRSPMSAKVIGRQWRRW